MPHDIEARLDHAIHLLREHGWARNTMLDAQTGRRCLAGAVRHARLQSLWTPYTLPPVPSPSGVVTDEDPTTERALMFVAEAIRDSDYALPYEFRDKVIVDRRDRTEANICSDDVVIWCNDHVIHQDEQAIELIEKARARAAEEGI